MSTTIVRWPFIYPSALPAFQAFLLWILFNKLQMGTDLQRNNTDQMCKSIQYSLFFLESVQCDFSQCAFKTKVQQ